ncbi:MAG: TIGR02281 family clan AA aspartic protease [Pseudomonadota bacterium]
MFDNPDDTAHLFYLLLLGMFIAVYLFSHYRGRMGQAMQHAAIWGLIFVGAILAVGFSGDLQRMLTNAPQQIDGETVALTREGDGHFHALMEVNGHDVRFIVDTGATNLVLSQRDAKAAGIDVGALAFTIPTYTANGRIMSAPVRLDEVRLAEFTDRDVRATVNGGDLDVSLLGMSYLERFSGWRVEGDRMYLTR